MTSLQPSLPRLGGGRYQAWIHSYFRSGWGFFIPYLAVYLLYAWRQWPVNPPGNASPGAGLPCLLHVYWFLHVLHLALGGAAAHAWWKNRTLAPARDWRMPYATFSWVCLAALFWIPGVYLEFPADSWQHYARTNEWAWLQNVTDHSFWRKSSYFLAYSLVGHLGPPLLQLKWFDVYYTGCCLLLCWQYYRLARAIGLGSRAAFLFVLLQALTFGNNHFDFYRYYAMSTTVFAQLGAVALVRIVLTALWVGPTEANCPGAFGPFRLSSPLRRDFVFLGLGIAALTLFTAFNHPQGLGIAGLSILAVVAWRLVEWRRSMIGWLTLAAGVLSVAALVLLPRHPYLDSLYRDRGWLSPWYGLNVLFPGSVANGRAMEILGWFGVLNLLAAVRLLWTNHVAGWLTLTPLVALALPCIAIPLANALASTTDFAEGYIFTFNRMLFAIPAGLALVVAGASIRAKPFLASPLSRLVSSTVAGLLLVGTSPSAKFYNRLYNAIMVPPDDLAMRHVVDSPLIHTLVSTPNPSRDERTEEGVHRSAVLTTRGIGYILNSTGETRIARAEKQLGPLTPPSLFAQSALANLRYVESGSYTVASFEPISVLFSPFSLTAHTSGHWLPNEIALEHSTQHELFAAHPALQLARRSPQLWLEWALPPPSPTYFGHGASLSVESLGQDRGNLNAQMESRTISAGEQIRLTPVLRTLDGNAEEVTMDVTTPNGSVASYTHSAPANVLGGDKWLFREFPVTLHQPGTYLIRLTGRVRWPTVEYGVTYTLDVAARGQ